MYDASHELFKKGLNINKSKLMEFINFQEFDDVYGFSIFEKLRLEKQDINQAFELFLIKRSSCPRCRESAVLKRMLHDQKRIKLLFFLWGENFLLFSSNHYMKQIYRMIKDDSEKKRIY